VKKSAVFLSLVLSLALLFSSCSMIRNADGTPIAESTAQTEEETANEPEREATNGKDEPLTGKKTEPLMQSDKDGGSPLTANLDSSKDPYFGVSVSLLAVGDNLIHPNIYTDAKDRGTAEKEYDFLPMYADVADRIAAADIAFINQETVMAGEEYGYSGYPCFNAPQQLGLDLVSLGFDVINIANNHMLDMGTKGLNDTIAFWNTLPVTLLGGYLNEDDYNTLRVTEADGVKIAWLSYTYATNGITKNAAYDTVIPYLDDDTVLADLARAKAESDFVIVSVHWGDENTQTPNAEQKRLASLFAENGADLILGHHSHTLQPMEWIETTGGKRVLCVYSLGNFVSGMVRPVNVVGGILTLDIVGDNAYGLTVDNVLFTPTVFWYSTTWYDTHLYLMRDFTDYLASRHGMAIEGYSMTLEKAHEIVHNVIADEFLPPEMQNGN